MERLRIDTGNRDDAYVVSLSGEFDISEAGALFEVARDVNGQTHVELDLSELTFIDSTGLRELLRFEADMRASGRELQVRPGPIAERMFELTDTAQLFNLLK